MIALAVRMGTRRGPIREAIRMLAGIGLVLAVPNRGVFVRQISVREMFEIYELRALLFGFAAQRAAEHLSDADKLAQAHVQHGRQRLLSTLDTPATPSAERRQRRQA